MHLKTILRLTIFLFLTLAMGGAALAEGNATGNSIRNVEVSLHLIDVEEIDSVMQSFIASVSVRYRWNDPGLAHGGRDSISRELKDIWHPRIQFLNQQALRKTFPLSAEVRPDGDVIYRQRVWGSFSQPLELADFPFDKQHIEIILASIPFGNTGVNLHVSPNSGISNNLKIPDWNLLDWSIAKGKTSVSAGAPDFSSIVLTLELERHASYFALKVILPLILIVCMSWMVFWIDPSLAASQISVSVTAMLTLIAYRFAINGMLPRLGFLTSMDYFVLGATIMVFLTLTEVVYTSHLNFSGRLDKARAIDRNAQWVAPLVFIALVVAAFF